MNLSYLTICHQKLCLNEIIPKKNLLHYRIQKQVWNTQYEAFFPWVPFENTHWDSCKVQPKSMALLRIHRPECLSGRGGEVEPERDYLLLLTVKTINCNDRPKLAIKSKIYQYFRCLRNPCKSPEGAPYECGLYVLDEREVRCGKGKGMSGLRDPIWPIIGTGGSEESCKRKGEIEVKIAFRSMNRNVNTWQIWI
jgi:hypothetical protein